MHQQEILRIFRLAHLLRHAGRHRNSGNTGRADQRVHFAVGGPAHQPAQQHAAGGAEAEGDQAQADDLCRVQVEEGVRIGRCV